MRNSYNAASVYSSDGAANSLYTLNEDSLHRPKQTKLGFVSKINVARFNNSCEPKVGRKRIVEKTQSSNVLLSNAANIN